MENLHSVPHGCVYLISSVPDVPLLHSLGVYEGATVRKQNTYGLGGPTLLVVDTREVAIGKKYATQILVQAKEG